MGPWGARGPHGPTVGPAVGPRRGEAPGPSGGAGCPPVAFPRPVAPPVRARAGRAPGHRPGKAPAGRSSGEAGRVRTAPADLDTPAVVPAQFLWRGRLYVVRAVLAHWIELGTWWVGPGSRRRRPVPVGAPVGPDAPEPSEYSEYPGAPEAPGAAATPRRSVAFDVGAVEREVWRVEARAGRSSSVGVYDLVRGVPAAAAALLDDPTACPPVPTRWRLARTLD